MNELNKYECKHSKFKHPFNCLIVGMTGSGKTLLMRRILKDFTNGFHNLGKDNLNVLWCYGQWNSLIDVPIADNVNVKYIEGIPEDFTEYNPDLLVIDDLMNEMNKAKDFESLFIKKSHHLNISVFFLAQNLFYNSKSMRTISLNCHYIIIMKNPRDQSQINAIARQIYPGNSKFLIDAYNDATESAYGYIRLDFTPDTPQTLRVQSKVTPEEHFDQYISIVYVPKHD